MTPATQPAWQRWDQRLGTWLPYVTLALPTALSLTQPGQSWSERFWTAAGALLAAAWVFALYTRAPAPRQAHPARMVAYVAGLLALGTALMAQQPIFFVFTVTGFFHAGLLRPRALAVLAVAITSILLNTVLTGFPWPNREAWFFFGTLIVVQTLAIGFGTLMAEQVAELSEQRRRAVVELGAALAENAALQAQLLAQARAAGVHDERQRLATEIHDTLAQGLVGITTQLAAAERTAAQPEQWRRHITAASDLARSSLNEARRSLAALQPAPLEHTPLSEAVAGLAHTWTTTSGVVVQMTVTGTARPLLAEIEATLYRVAQEALANVARHARATRVGLTLSYMEDMVVLDVRDDGIGFEPHRLRDVLPAQPGSGLGLPGMTRRLQRVAGSLTVESAPGAGTAVSASVPALPAAEGGDAR